MTINCLRRASSEGWGRRDASPHAMHWQQSPARLVVSETNWITNTPSIIAVCVWIVAPQTATELVRIKKSAANAAARRADWERLEKVHGCIRAALLVAISLRSPLSAPPFAFLFPFGRCAENEENSARLSLHTSVEFRGAGKSLPAASRAFSFFFICRTPQFHRKPIRIPRAQQPSRTNLRKAEEENAFSLNFKIRVLFELTI